MIREEPLEVEELVLEGVLLICEELELDIPGLLILEELLLEPLIEALFEKERLTFLTSDRARTLAALELDKLVLLKTGFTDGCLLVRDIFPKRVTLLLFKATLETFRFWSWLLCTTVKARELTG